MALDKIKKFLDEVKTDVDDPRFFSRIFSLLSKNRLKKEHIYECLSEEYDDLSRRLERSKIQEAVAARNVLRVRKLANLLINEKGELQSPLVAEAIKALKQTFYSLGPERQHDIKRQEHLLKVLQILQSSKEAVKLLNSISKPLNLRQADVVIKDTLQLTSKEVITDAHAKRAALSAWMTYLRQNVGSCFATAPAIIIHDDEPLQFLIDIRDLLSTGRLKRTFEGVEYNVPLSITSGAGDLKKNFILNLQEEDGIEIWLSPGIKDAFLAMGIFGEELSKKEQYIKVKEIIFSVFQGPAVVVNVEEILKKVLKARLGTASFSTRLEAGEKAFKALADNALLKSWEFTLASFAETKAEFTKWNLYSSLGLGSQEKGGIGFCLYEVLQKRLHISNEKVRELQEEYETKYSHLKYLEARLQRASEKEAEWLKIDYKTKLYEFQTIEDIRDKERQKGQRLANLYNELINEYYNLFPQYFQEVYDADMHEIALGPYDDSPAGFRLLYKHGRSNTSQWSYIHTPQEFISALNSFFLASETEFTYKEEFAGLEAEITEIITSIVTHIKTDEFIESAFYRIASVHNTSPIKNPLENLEKIDKKPWAYTSGGTMGSLVSCYFGLREKPREVLRWVENPMELLVFLLDTLKQIPFKAMEDLAKEGVTSLLMHSPTHAFLLKPYYKRFYEAWQNETFTYTYARDTLVKPMQYALETIFLDEGMMSFLVEKLSHSVPKEYRYYFKKNFERLYGTMLPYEFRKHLVETMAETGKKPLLSADEIDSFLFSTLPLFPIYQMRERLENILERDSGIKR